jgi:hypothetical protein
VKPQFRLSNKDNFWVVEVFYIPNADDTLFSDWEFEEPFNEAVYQMMSNWCYEKFKTWLTPRRARRMSFNQFYFKSKKDADWFMLYWAGIDID